MKPGTLAIALLLAMLGAGTGVASNSASDAEFTFTIAQRRGWNTNALLAWTFQVEGVPAAHVKALSDALIDAGFSQIAVPENDQENDAGIHAVWFSDVRAHTVASLAARIDTVSALLREHGGALEYQSVEQPDAAP